MSAVADAFFSLFLKSDLIFFMLYHNMYLKEPKKTDIYAHLCALLRDIELLPCTPLTLQERG